ncbi:MAG: hypothetical protein ACREBA_08085 [Nitrosotalea sp.]
MDVKNPLYLKKIIGHYQSRIHKLRSNNSFEIRTEIANGFMDKTLQAIPGLIDTLGNIDKEIRINETSFPHYQNIICVALDQYVRDLNADWNTLENQLIHDPSYLGQIKKEIALVKSIKKDCNCNR